MAERRIIDLSVALEDSPSEPLPVRRIVLEEHVGGADRLGRRLRKDPSSPWRQSGKALSHRDFPDGHFINNEQITASVHAGTHLDAPAHYGLICDGSPPRTVEQIPLEWCYGPGVVLDMTAKRPGELIIPDDLETELVRIGYQIKPGDIVLIRTGADKLWGQTAYFTSFPGMGREATAWLVEKGVRVMGTDAYSFDRPFCVMLNDYLLTGDNRVLWPAHIYGRTREYLHLERLANLDQLPYPFGFTVSCFPIKITGAGAAWARVVAIIDETPAGG